jgi:Ca2+-binding EF-hand superfamily protein
MSACIDRKVLNNEDDIKTAFKLLDTNKDGSITIDDFNELFNSYGGAKMDDELWNCLLKEADKNGDGIIGFLEFKDAMTQVIKDNLNKKRRTN